MSDDDLFDYERRRRESEAAKKEAMQRVEANANKAWSDFMLNLVYLTCREQYRFTTDEPMDRYDAAPEPKPVTHEKRAMGPVMTRAAKMGYCRKTNIVEPSRRSKLHASPIAIWESLIYAR